MSKLSDIWRDDDTGGPNTPDVRLVRWNEQADELEGDPDVIINHHRVDENGNRIEPEGIADG